MRSASEALMFLNNIRRNASTAASKVTPKVNTLKPKAPPRSSQPKASEPRSKSPRTENAGSHGGEPQSAKGGRFQNFLSHPRYLYTRRGILAIPAILLAILHLPYEVLNANGQSMSPFLNPNSSDALPGKDRVLVKRWQTSIEAEHRQTTENTSPQEKSRTPFQRGQIVTFSAPHSPQKIAVKRIVAIPGDLVQPLPEYPGGDAPVVIPWNHVWVEGDSGTRKESMDSNWYGPISMNLIIGEVKAVRSSWLQWAWLDWRQHSWPARTNGRVDEDAIAEASVNPDDVTYSSGWRNGSIALILERTRRRPDQAIWSFVNDTKARQETRKLYNNALYVAEVATSPQEKQLATELVDEMEDVYGREALVFGIRMKRRGRDRGQLPGADEFTPGENSSQSRAASEAERVLKKQGWELERNSDGTVKTQQPIST